MAGVDADIIVRIKGGYSGTADLASLNATFDVNNILSLASGTGTGKADLMWSDTRTIAASSSENIDLAGSLVDAFGATLTFAKIKAIYIKASSGNTNSVKVGGAASNAFVGPFADTSDIMNLVPGADILLRNDSGWTVTAATGDILKIANSSSGTGVTYDIVIIGTSV